MARIDQLQQAAKVAWLRTRQNQANCRQFNSLVIKMTQDCNLRCRYCYAKGGSVKTQVDVATALTFLDQAADVTPWPLTVCFHGGEPLVAAGRLQAIVTALSERDYFLRTSLLIQSNATLIDEEWARFFKRWNIKVGISLDGVGPINDTFRYGPHHQGSFAQVVRGMDCLDKAGVPYALLAVLSRNNIHHLADLTKFAADRRVSGLSFELVEPAGYGAKQHDLIPHPLEHFEAMKEILWWLHAHNQANPESPMTERSLRFLVKNIIQSDKKSYMCLSAPCGAGLEHLAMSVDGTIYICDKFLDNPAFALGNIGATPLVEMIAVHPLITRFSQRVPSAMERCAACEHRLLCTGGCPAAAYHTFGSIERESPACGYLQLMIPYLQRSLVDGTLDPRLIGAV